MARKPKGRDGFASTGLVFLTIEALRKIDPCIVGGGVRGPDPMRSATIEASEKRQLLDQVLKSHGAGPLLQIGQHLHLGEGYPSLEVLNRAQPPEVLAEKWTRLERYYHATNRTRIEVGKQQLTCIRHATEGQPTLAENLFIAGLIFGLCARSAVQNLTLELGAKRLAAEDLGNVKIRIGERASRFRIVWTDWSAPIERGEDEGQDRVLEPLQRRLKNLIEADAGRSWCIADVAHLLAKSPRSLQRELTASRSSFSSILRNARIDAASRMLSEGDTSLAEIGYCCGYTDQAHFQRDFRRVMNITPAGYRDIVFVRG